MKWILGTLFVFLVLISACVQQPTATTTTLPPQTQEQATQQAEDMLTGEVESAVENITTEDIESAITGAATQG